MESNVTSLENPRKNAIDAMKESVSREQWESNMKLTNSLRQKIKAHPITCHPAIEALEQGCFSIDEVRQIHLEYRHAIVQLFTDALLIAQVQARQLEPRLPPGSKMAPRFLLTLNVLDELGFEPGLDSTGYYRGSPRLAHYPLFERVLDALGISQHKRQSYIPSRHAKDLNNFLQDAFGDYATILVLLAAAEEQVIIFSPPLRAATSHVGVGVDSGYYHVHGTSQLDNTNAHDDDHEEDLWMALNHACTVEGYERVEVALLTYLDMWYQFWNQQLLAANVAAYEPDHEPNGHRGRKGWKSGYLTEEI